MTRAEAMQPADAAAGFDALVAGLREQRDQVSTLRPELSFEDVPAPRTLAPYATAMAATVLDGETDIASGRLVLLYDPAGQDGWGGPLRIIVYVRADLDPEIAADPLIGQVGWDWLTEALDNRTAGYGQPSGTVTRVVTEGFGAKESEPAVTGFELRASWSPAELPAGTAAGPSAGAGAGTAAVVGAGTAAGPSAGVGAGTAARAGGEGPLDGHLAAWCDALCAAAGLPPLAPGVTALRKPSPTTRRRR